MDGELVRLGAELFVFRSGHADAPNTAGIAALTDQIEELLLQLERLGEILDPLVHLSKDGLVQPDAFLTRAHRDRPYPSTAVWSFSTTT
ncbi:MAG: hypothetical protein E6G03_04170 [Actinobacteria bacterium]|nr:MAG: hypothetical protein E6G03_04170 [Actinomycetota bacterium]